MLASLRHNPTIIPALVFLLIVVAIPQTGGTNADARLATMAALVTQHTFSINKYPWTNDWARSPVNGAIYANKPPGPAILGAPVYWLINHVQRTIAPDSSATPARLFAARETYGHIISLLLQAVPYAFLTMLAAAWLQKQNLPAVAVHFGTLAILFGSTASLLMNSYFGHGLAAVFFLATTLSVLQKRYRLAGFVFGWALLCDYGAALLLLPVIGSIAWQEGHRTPAALLRFLGGGIVPATIWVAYHYLIFGHPFALATRFQNPVFMASEASAYTIWGLFSAPSPTTLALLLFGEQRGLSLTQPWIILTAASSLLLLRPKVAQHRQFVSLAIIAVGGLLLLMLANSSFNGWHGGWTPGPRYLSVVLPVFGVLAAFVYAQAPAWLRPTLWLSLSVSLLLFLVASATTILAVNNVPLWSFYWFILNHLSKTGLLNILFSTAALIIAVSAPALTHWLAHQKRKVYTSRTGDTPAR